MVSRDVLQTIRVNRQFASRQTGLRNLVDLDVVLLDAVVCVPAFEVVAAPIAGGAFGGSGTHRHAGEAVSAVRHHSGRGVVRC